MNKTTLIAEENSQAVIFERVFDAPREQVFEVFSKKEYIEKWWSPGGTAIVSEFDFREGGRWQFSTQGDTDGDVTFHGYFHEITAPQRYVHTSEFDNLEQMIGERGHTVLAKYEFLEHEGNKTKLVTTEIYMSVQDRNMAIESGMESGAAKSYEQVDAVLQEIA